jgi:signal transduction histidine kinase/ActR/RegA family two-component response regulator
MIEGETARNFEKLSESYPFEKRMSTFDTTSINHLRESILRRIMRAACIVGVVGLALAIVFVRPFDVRGAVIGAIAMVIVYTVTLLPQRHTVLSIVYPWALVLTGAGLAWSMGPKTEPFILTVGGFFIGSLVLGGRQLALLVSVSLLAGFSALFWSVQPFHPDVKAAWINSVTSMASVVLPATIAGRMLVSALDRAISQRESLVRELIEESRSRENTLRALESARSQLTHAQKIELIGQLAGGIAHDMNNALTAVMGEASLLGEETREERESILEAAEYAAKLTRQLMVLGRRDTHQPRPIDLNSTIQGLFQSIRRMIPSEIAIEIKAKSLPVAIVADPTQLLQLLLNLASNAKDAMPNGGQLTIELTVDNVARQAILEITDTGTGIPEATIPCIFEPFFTTKPAGKGTGLGLANVKQLVESMSGTIDVRSQLGIGTTFTIRVPITDLPIVNETKVSREKRARTGTVLVVDDDVRVRAVVYTALERVGYRVLEAATPDAAVAIVQERTNGIDLLLTDVVMGGGGGAHVIREVIRICPSIKILVMSGYADDETLRRGIAKGEYPFISKPFVADALAQAVDQALC